MGLPYLKVEADEAIAIINQCIVAGYKIKDEITNDYHNDKENAQAKIEEWRKHSWDWAVDTMNKLSDVFVSEKELYNFRDASPPFGATSENVQYFGTVQTMKARIDKLNTYDEKISQNFNVHLDVVMRDKITQIGDNGTVTTKN
jgi:hypothetical protein